MLSQQSNKEIRLTLAMVLAYKVHNFSFEPAARSDMYVPDMQRNCLTGVRSEMEPQRCEDVIMYGVDNVNCW